MSSIAISSIVFALVFGGGLLGMYLHKVLPKEHLSDDSKDVVRLGMGLVATMTALVLGLVISSAKNSFDALSGEMTGASSKIILLDQTLALYGPETKAARDMLRSSVAGVLDRMESKKSRNPAQLRTSTREVDSLYKKIQELSPTDDRQRSIQARALSLLISLQETRWLIYEQESTSISMPMLIILLSWLTTLFISFGLFAPANRIAVTALLVSGLSVSGAILLILELYSPYAGLIRISSAPLRAALTQLGN
jgi:uncharacterized protein (DUF486 family)